MYTRKGMGGGTEKEIKEFTWKTSFTYYSFLFLFFSDPLFHTTSVSRDGPKKLLILYIFSGHYTHMERRNKKLNQIKKKGKKLIFDFLLLSEKLGEAGSKGQHTQEKRENIFIYTKREEKPG
jgi:hypothetical protein